MTPKNNIVRSRGDYPGEAGADWESGASAKPQADEHYKRGSGGLRGEDKQQGKLRDQPSSVQAPTRGEPSETQRSPHQNLQHGAEVRGNPPMVRGADEIASLPEGLRRERQGPYDKSLGRYKGAMAENKGDHWKDIGTSKPEKEPGPYAQDKSRKLPTKERQDQYEKAGEAGRKTGKTFKK